MKQNDNDSGWLHSLDERGIPLLNCKKKMKRQMWINQIIFGVRKYMKQNKILSTTPVRLVPFNLAKDDNARTLKAGYYKTGRANLNAHQAFGATGVMEIIETK